MWGNSYSRCNVKSKFCKISLKLILLGKRSIPHSQTGRNLYFKIASHAESWAFLFLHMNLNFSASEAGDYSINTPNVNGIYCSKVNEFIVSTIFWCSIRNVLFNYA